MTINEINYSETIELPGIWKKIGVRASLDEGDNKDECFRQLQSTVKEWQQSSPQQRFERVANETPIPIISLNKDVELAMIDEINSCTDVEVLESYKLIVRSNPAWNDAYRNKLIELQKPK